MFTACTPVPQLRNEELLQDLSLISGEPCSAPCWENMIPGETSWDDAVTILSENADFTNLDRDRNRETGEEIYNFNYLDGSQCCRIYSRDGELLSSVLLLLAPNMTLSQVIEVYGEPLYFSGEDVTETQSFLSLVYVDTPMIVYAFSAGLAEGEISSASEVIGVIYLAPSEMELLLATEELREWHGYGNLSELLAGEPVIQNSSQ